jgi:hypothetical protein
MVPSPKVGPRLLWVSALLFILLPLGAQAQASSAHFLLKKSTLSAAGSKGLSDAGNTLRMGASAAQETVTGRAASTHFVLRAGFWGAPSAATPVVPGDCDGDGTVSIGEVQKAINMFLGIAQAGAPVPPDCGVDCNGDGTVSIGEVQKVINAFLGLTSSC